jgi:hypothetical protein
VKKTVATVTVNKFTSTTSSVNITWEKVADAAGYRIYRYNTSTKKWDTLTTIKNGSTLNYKQTGLKAGTEYKYRVKAYVKSDGKTYWSSNSKTLTTATKTATPKFSKTTSAKTSVQLTWKKVTGATGYTLQKYDSAKKAWVTVKSVSSSTTSYKVTGLKKNTSYKFRIRAYKKVGSTTLYSGWSTTQTVKTKK